MAYAHQGIEIKPLPGVAPGPTPPAPAVAQAVSSGPDANQQRPTLLTKRAAEVLVRLERTMENATRALATTATAPRAEAPPATPRATTGVARN
jgi:penicillin-binding protein 1A